MPFQWRSFFGCLSRRRTVAFSQVSRFVGLGASSVQPGFGVFSYLKVWSFGRQPIINIRTRNEMVSTRKETSLTNRWQSCIYLSIRVAQSLHTCEIQGVAHHFSQCSATSVESPSANGAIYQWQRRAQLNALSDWRRLCQEGMGKNLRT